MTVAVGDRVLIVKQAATVRYVGTVNGHDGIWAGVEWDDTSRGKHDGAVDGKRYFACQSSSPTAASFVRINKVGQGTSLVDALMLRYTNQRAEGQAMSDSQVYFSTSNKCKVRVELVGEEKVTERQRKTDQLVSARLVGAQVASVGPPGQLACAACNLKQLDLTDNLIGSWPTVTAICQELPRLQLLNLSHNRLALPNSCSEAGFQQLPGVQCLVVNHCGITWQQVGVMQTALPHLKELHAAGNNISSLQLQPVIDKEQHQQLSQGPQHNLVGFSCIETLGLEHNSIADWQEVLCLAGLPRLKRLHLSGNPIPQASYQPWPIPHGALFQEMPSQLEEAEQTAGHAGLHAQQRRQQQQQPFAALEALLLGSCQISQWNDVDELNKFPSLHELRLSGNPLFQGEGAGRVAGQRFEVIGRVAGLTLLNGADVRPRERRDCELRYLQNIAAEAAEAAAQQQQQPELQAELHRRHPRLAQLQAKYGPVGVLASKPMKAGTTLSSATSELLLQHAGTTKTKKLPKTVTVSSLKLLCSKLFKLPPDQQTLLLRMPTTVEGSAGQAHQAEDIGQDDTKTLGYWDVVDGCIIEVV